MATINELSLQQPSNEPEQGHSTDQTMTHDHKTDKPMTQDGNTAQPMTQDHKTDKPMTQDGNTAQPMTQDHKRESKMASALLPTDHQHLMNMGATDQQIKEMEQQKREQIDRKIDIYFPKKVLNIVLIGESGSGKSSVGNLILGEEKFDVSSGATTCTTEIECHECEFEGEQLRVIDTPGCLDTSDVANKIPEELKNVDGDGLYVLVMNMEQTTTAKDTQERLLTIKAKLSNVDLHQCVLVYTHGKSLFNKKDLKKQTLDGYLRCMLSIDDSQEGTDKECQLKEIYQTFRNQVVAIDNVDISPYEKNKVRMSLLLYLKITPKTNIYRFRSYQLEKTGESWLKRQWNKIASIFPSRQSSSQVRA